MLFSLFFFSFFIPQGGGVGIVTSLGLLLWIGLGASVTGTSVVLKPPVSTVNCGANLTKSAAVVTNISTTTIDYAHPVTSAFDKYE